ncbi:MAG TPA: hypothetical protein VIV11_12695 [Kofleriaceae bacterium]
MRIAMCISLILIACGPGRTTFARYPGSSPTFDRASADPKALAVADKVIVAAGGAARWNEAKQLRWSQVVMLDGKQVIAGEQAWDRWNGRHHARVRREDGDVVVMRPLYEDGGSAFVDKDKQLRKIESGSVESVAAARERWEFDTAMLFMPFLLEEPGTKLTYEAERNGQDGKPRDVLIVTFPKDPTRRAVYHIDVNRETNMIDRIEIQKAGASSLERLGYSVKDWQDGGGIKFPGTLQNIGMPGEVITFKDLTVSEPDDTLFVPPAMM